MKNIVKNHFTRSIISICLIAASTVAFALAASKPGTSPSGNGSLAPAGSPPTCTPPGTLVASDPAGDQTGAPAANQQLDILSVSIAEPCFADNVNKLVFTLKVSDLTTVPPNGHWKVEFAPPTLPAGITAYFVEMLSDQDGNVSYEYGTVGTTTTSLGTVDDGSKNAIGTITITVANNKVGNPTTGQTLTAVQAQTQLLVGAAGTGLLAGIDSSTVTGTTPSYTLAGHALCACPAPTPTPSPTPSPGPTAATPRY